MNVVLLFSSFSVQFRYMIICMVFVLVLEVGSSSIGNGRFGFAGYFILNQSN